MVDVPEPVTPPIAIMWFRQDLRLADNPALLAAARQGAVLPVYILDDVNPGDWRMGAASRWWLHQSLTRLKESLDNRLLLLRGDPRQLLPLLARSHQAEAVYWNRCYEPWRQQRDSAIKQNLRDSGIAVHSSKASLLWEPWEVHKQDGSAYRVFTPFYKNGCLAQPEPRQPLARPESLTLVDHGITDQGIDVLRLLPSITWYESMASSWASGEQGARATLDAFLEQGLHHYKKGRDFPALNAVSRLSPYLHHGELSPFQVWHAVMQAAPAAGLEDQIEHFRRELVWREFSHHLLYHFPQLTRQNLQAAFDRFPWRSDPMALRRWQRGLTGYPIVDAGMRELWQTGYMHNRVRMIVASFLVKNLLLHWHHGEDWFWDCLVDANLANNSASWQWVAGCGADAAPYFRIFNPVTQGLKFDATGTYVRRYVPELAKLPDRWLHDPSSAPAEVLRQAGIILDKDYPRAMVDLRESRERALAAYQSLKSVV
ncbi:MAG: hypothetical protein RLZZ385_216 [Pseudomonadota bacterium]